MTVKSDVKKSIAACEALRGSYILAAETTEDQLAKKMYNEMKADLEKHLIYLANRLDYINLNNELNKK